MDNNPFENYFGLDLEQPLNEGGEWYFAVCLHNKNDYLEFI